MARNPKPSGRNSVPLVRDNYDVEGAVLGDPDGSIRKGKGSHRNWKVEREERTHKGTYYVGTYPKGTAKAITNDLVEAGVWPIKKAAAALAVALPVTFAVVWKVMALIVG